MPSSYAEIVPLESRVVMLRDSSSGTIRRMRLLLLPFLLFLPLSAALATQGLEQAITRFVLRETQGLPGKVSVKVEALAAGTQVGSCVNPEVFLPSGSRLWGALRIGVRCAEPSAWTVYVPIEVRVHGRHLVAGRKIAAGQTVGELDIVEREGDLTRLPSGILTEPGQALGKRARIGVAADVALRAEHLVQLPVIRQGQAVKLLVKGPSFSASSEGTALANAYAGERLRVKTAAGHTVIGTATPDGAVELKN
jgi:flagellar basal body P-ring formation protein FlgA